MFKLKEVMEMLNIPERTIRRHIKLGILKGEKVGGVWRFSEDNLSKYFSNATVMKSQSAVKYTEIFDYINGISKHGNDIAIIKQLNKLNLLKNKKLSQYVSSFADPFYFNIDTKFGKSVIVFKGSEKNAIELIGYINKLD